MKQFVKKIGSLPMEGNVLGTVHVLVRCDESDEMAIQIAPVDCVANELFPNRDHANHQYKIAARWHFSLINNLGGLFSVSAPHYVIEGYQTKFGSKEEAEQVGNGRDDFRWTPRLTVDEFEGDVDDDGGNSSIEDHEPTVDGEGLREFHD